MGGSGNLHPLDRRKGLHSDVRTDFLDGLDDVDIVGIGQLGVDSRDHVDFGYGDVQILSHAFLNVFGREHISPTVFRRHVEGAESAELVADVGVVDVLVAHVPGHVPA